MIEIVLQVPVLLFLGKKLADMVQRKGRAPYNFVYLFVVLWFVGEVAGFVVGSYIFSSDDPFESVRMFWDNILAVYAIGLAGAVIGGSIGYLVARLAAPGEISEETESEPEA